MRHVLRARAEAVRALAGFFEQLEKAGSAKRVRASPHLARAYGGWVEEQVELEPDVTVELAEKSVAAAVVVGWRSAEEVVGFLRKKGAKFPTLGRRIEGEWAALSSEGEPGEVNPSYDSDCGASAVWVSAE